MQRTRYTRQTVETSKLPSRGTFPDNRPTIYIQKHKTSVKNKIAWTTAQPTDKNYTVKDFCSNKTLKIDENCKETPTLHFCTKRCWKKHRHTRWKETKKTTEALPFPLFSFNWITQIFAFFVALLLQNFSVDVQKISIRVQISVTNQPCQYLSVACHRSP